MSDRILVDRGGRYTQNQRERVCQTECVIQREIDSERDRDRDRERQIVVDLPVLRVPSSRWSSWSVPLWPGQH